MRILVTGGCGFIGSNFIKHILNTYEDYKIYNVDKLTYAGSEDNLGEFNSLIPLIYYVATEVAS